MYAGVYGRAGVRAQSLNVSATATGNDKESQFCLDSLAGFAYAVPECASAEPRRSVWVDEVLSYRAKVEYALGMEGAQLQRLC